jgi:hypothetical protein
VDDNLPVLDPNSHIYHLARLVWRRSLFPRLMRAMTLLPRVFGEDLPKMSSTVDQQGVKALAPWRSRIPLRERVRPR